MSFEERYVEMLQNAVEKVKTEEDPIELNELKKLFKKNVPLALRSYVAAYLAKKSVWGGKRDSFKSRKDSFHSRRERFDSSLEKREPAPRVVIPEELATQIFISIGRNRRVFPRDLISLIIQNSSIERARIGDIRILDNYSFVQLYTEDCDTVISAMDGIEYRGRKLTVSYSRKRMDDEKFDDRIDDKYDERIDDHYYDENSQAIDDSNEALQYDEEDRAAYALAEKAAEAASKHGAY